MSFVQARGLKYFQFDLFHEHPEVVHGVFTRQGGVSPQPWTSLNMATSVGDSRENVLENRQRMLDALELPGWGFFDVWQVHSATVVPTQSRRSLEQPHQKADSILTDRSGVALLMLFADCVPVFLYDPIHRAVGMAHAGWQGSVKKIAARAVEQMAAVYASRPEDLLAAIGPSICQAHYEVGGDVIQQVEAAFGGESGLMQPSNDGKALLDLWETNRRVLLESGVLADHIEVAGLCTAESPADWYSHRGERGATGRFGAVMAVRNGWSA